MILTVFLFFIIICFLFIFVIIFLSIYHLLVSTTTEHKTSCFIFYLPLSVYVPTVSLLLRRFVSMSFCSLSTFFCLKFLPVSVFLSLFVCLFGCYPAPVIIFANCLYFYSKFWFCGTIFIFINHHPSSFTSFFHSSIGGEFKVLSSSGMVCPYPSLVWVSCLR